MGLIRMTKKRHLRPTRPALHARTARSFRQRPPVLVGQKTQRLRRRSPSVAPFSLIIHRPDVVVSAGGWCEGSRGAGGEGVETIGDVEHAVVSTIVVDSDTGGAGQAVAVHAAAVSVRAGVPLVVRMECYGRTAARSSVSSPMEHAGPK